MKNESYYRLNNLIICSTPNKNLCWLTFEKNGDECTYQTGYAKLVRKKNILVLLPKINEKAIPFDAYLAYVEVLPKLPKYSTSKYYCKYEEFEVFRVYYTHSNNQVSELIAKDLIIRVFPDVLMFKKQILVEKINNTEKID